MIVGTAGHIDHGKTALIKALTGVDADRLKEEKARGITIDLGYAYHPLPNGRVLGFIDVPGHERFIRNMLAGVTGIDCVLLLVAADDGVMPQTREHLEIIDLLGIPRGIVAITKIDRVDDARRLQVGAEVESLLVGTTLAGSPVFPVSSVSGEGVDGLRSYLEASAVAGETRPLGGNFRQAVDRCFTLAGIGTIATGTVFAGRVRIGDRLLVSPSGTEVRVRAIHAQNREAQTGEAGERCALNLVGVEKKDIARGDWLLSPALHQPSPRFDARVRLAGSGARALRHWTPVHVHLGACDVSGRVSLLEGTVIEPGGGGLVQIVLDRPVGVLYGDRFIVRDQSAKNTLAGGVVLDPFAPTRKVRTTQRMALLGALGCEAARDALALLLENASAGVDLNGFARGRNLRDDAMELLLGALPVVIIPAGGNRHVGFSPARWMALQEAVVDTLAAEHRCAPEVLGLHGRQLRRLATPDTSWEVFLALIGQLLAEQRVTRHGPWLHLPTHRITPTPLEEKLWYSVAPLLRSTPFQPPWVRDIARKLSVPEIPVRAMLRRMTILGDTHEVVHDRFFTQEALARIAAIASEITLEKTEIRAGELRDRLGIGRKLAIQILEYFDKAGVSRRIGDAHRMRVTTLFVDKAGSPAAGLVPATEVSGRDSYPGGAT